MDQRQGAQSTMQDQRHEWHEASTRQHPPRRPRARDRRRAAGALWPAALAALLCLCWPAGARAGFYVFNSFSIPWSSVPSTSEPTPAKNLTANCICNLNAYVCDVNCCCDESCVPAVVSAASEANRCLPAGPPNETLNWCSPSTSQQQVNLPSNGNFYDITVVPAPDTFVDQLLCIVKSRSPDLGDNFPDPPVGNTNNNAAAVGSCPAQASVQSPASYQFNTPVYVKFRNNTKEPLTLPYAVISNECSDQFQVGFLSSIPDGSPSTFAACTRQLVNSTGSSILEGVCNSPAASISKFANMGFYASLGATTTTAVTISAINVLNTTTGTTVPLNSTATSATTYYNTTTGVCSNFVVGVRINIFYSWADTGVGSINSMSVVLLVTNVTYRAKWVPQQVQVLWAQQQPNDDRVLVSFSGNPGYLEGFPVLAGSITSNPSNVNQVAISRLVQGLPMPVAANNGLCSSVGQAPVTFGYNSTSNCAIPLTASMLADFCQNNTKNPTVFLQTLLDGVWTSIANSSLYVGIWGNSNASLTAEWLQVTVTGWPNPSDLIYTDRQCASVIVGYDLQILTGLSGDATNPQSKVLFANLCLRSATWTFPAGQDADVPYPFTMTSSVSFIAKQQSTQSQSKPYPPLLRPLPESIFYPFVTSAASVAVPAPVLLTLLLSLAVALALGVLL